MDKKECKKWMGNINKFIEVADEVTININRGYESKVDPKTWWMVNKPNGKTTITIHTYHKKNDKTGGLPKEPKYFGKEEE